MSPCWTPTTPAALTAASTACGTIRLRRTLTDPAGGRRTTAIRFRAVKISTANGQSSSDSRLADVRLLSSSDERVALSNGSIVAVQGITLEDPSASTPGGGHNASMVEGTLALATPLEPGTARSYSFLLGVAKTGSFFVNLNVEALPVTP